MSHDQKLQVAPPRQCNLQLFPSDSATFKADGATCNATDDLKALADRYLEKQQRNRPCNSPATEGEKTGQLPGDFEGPEVALDEASVAYSEERPNWLAWITDRCPLVPKDRAHVAKGLCRLHPRFQQRLAERYVETWHAVGDEPKHHNHDKRDNAGRRAANRIITRLLAGKEAP